MSRAEAEAGSAPAAAGERDRFAAFAEVALPVPVARAFTYGVPPAMASRVRPGCRVRARFGPRLLVGCVLDVRAEPPASVPPGVAIKPLAAVLDGGEPVLPPPLVALGRWLADYYLAPPGEVFRALLPPETPRGATVRFERTAKAAEARLRAGSLRARVLAALDAPATSAALARRLGSKGVAAALRSLVEAGYVRRVEHDARGEGRRVLAARLTEEGRRALAAPSLRADWARVLSLLARATDAVPLRTIRSELGLKAGPFRTLARRGYLRLEGQAVRLSPWERIEGTEASPVVLSEEQRRVVEDLLERLDGGFHPVVLHGVTGSGKTEVYLRLAEEAVRRGRTVLVLVPEIALAPRLAGLLRGRFGAGVAILHSGLGAGERRDEWWRIRRGEARVVVGARAAVLAPLTEIGLIVVDEEHETSYKQEEAPRYQARDVAVWRARQEGALVVLGSATPSLESYAHARSGRYGLARLPRRIGERPLARVELVDMRRVVREEGPETIVSAPLRDALAARLAAGEQAVVLLNRRGYAGQLVCRECGLAAQCSECSVALTLHRRGRLAVCHYCGLGRETPERCDVCRGEYLRPRGYGTERVEEILRGSFPEARVARMDRDTMRRKGSYEELLGRFGRGELDLLVGTQMVAKGHDFPAVTLVGVLAADAGLGVPDFRAAERTFQLLTQVAGRAGRGDRPGEVLIQTFVPDHYALAYAAAQDYEGFFEEEMRFRRGLGYPPLLALVNLLFEAPAMPEATRAARRAADALRRASPPGVVVLGPAFAARSKVAGRYRCQVLLKVPRPVHRAVRRVLGRLLDEPELARRMSVDVDPASLH